MKFEIDRLIDYDDDEILAELKRVAAIAPEPAVPIQKVDRVAEDVRKIGLGLRFRVLHRDRFRCVLCGDHPARNADCVLHVDHVIPWANGGRTREDNLRTLCATCNVGRGNRFSD